MGGEVQRASSRQPADAPMTEAKLPTKRPARHPSSPHPLRCRKTCPNGQSGTGRLPPCVPLTLHSVRQTSSHCEFAAAHGVCGSSYFNSSTAERHPLQLASLEQPKRSSTPSASARQPQTARLVFKVSSLSAAPPRRDTAASAAGLKRSRCRDFRLSPKARRLDLSLPHRPTGAIIRPAP